MEKKIKKWLEYLGFEKYSPYIKEHLTLSNARSGIYLAVVVIGLETWMILSVIGNLLMAKMVRSTTWIINHLSAYIALLLLGIFLLVYCLKKLRGASISHFTGNTIRTTFAVAGLVFGAYIAYLDYAKGEQVLSFTTMEVFILCLIGWRPFVSFLVLTVTCLVFYFICDRAVPASYATQVNLFTFWVAMLMAAVSCFRQKLVWARKDEALENSNAMLQKKSSIDELTGLYNPSHFRKLIHEILVDPNVDISKKIFLFVDVEHFKGFNGRYGYVRGNELLQSVADMLKSEFPDALIARMSDDRFALFADDRDVVERMARIKEKVMEVKSEVRMGLKVGGYKTRDRSYSPDIAIDNAHYACMHIKKDFTTFYYLYDEKMHTEVHQRNYILNNIDDAIEKGYIVPYYQPVVSSADGKVCGLEALARWNAPRYGQLQPSLFVPVLEEYRLIYQLDRFLMECVCRDLAEAMENGLKVVPVSLNFSRLDFELCEDLAAEVDLCRERYSIPRNMLLVEVTESALATDSIILQSTMDKFHRRGYEIWLDDFGSGYSGLNVLKEFDFDMMKIDLNFLRNFSTNKKVFPILRSIVEMAHAVGMHTLCEGVESQEASDFLKEIGCQMQQGYLFGKPMPKSEFIEGIESGKYVLADIA
jgi:diguanylate cyclase (GGDEF)-like protein